MRTRIYANADHASYRTTERRRLADLDFLDRIRSMRTAGGVEALERMLFEHRHAPRWKRIAIRRALERLEREGTTR